MASQEVDKQADASAGEEISDDELLSVIKQVFVDGASFRQARGVDKPAMEAVYQLAYDQYGSGNYEKALPVFKFLCYFDHLEQKYWIGLGATRQALGDHQAAIEAFSMAGMLNIHDCRPPLYAAQSHLALGHRTEAISGLQFCLNATEPAGERLSATQKKAQLILEQIEASRTELN